MKFNKNKKFIIASSLIALIIILIFSFIWNKKIKEEKNKVPVQTSLVKRGEIIKSVFANGKIISNFEVEIKGKGSGKIIKLPFDISDKVKKGDLLVELDPIDEERSVEQASASLAAQREQIAAANLNLQVSQKTLKTELSKAGSNLSAAEVKYNEARAKLDRSESLYKDSFISKEEHDSNLSNFTQAKADLNNARTRQEELKTEELNLRVKAHEVRIAQDNALSSNVGLLNAQRKLSETKIYSPIDGVVTARSGQIGNIVASGINNVGGGTTIMTIADLSKLFTLASIDESDIGRVELGQIVRITADSFPDEIFEGKVVQVASKGINTSNVITFDVKIEITGENAYKLKPEMTTNVEIIIERKENVLYLPLEAIIEENGRKTVEILKKSKDKPETRVIKTGMNNGNIIEILEGVKEGEKVIINKSELNSRWKKDKNKNEDKDKMTRGMVMSGRQFKK